MDRLAAASVQRREASTLPDWPADCRPPAAPSLHAGDRLDLVALRLAAERAALARRLAACEAWYQTLRRGRGGSG